MALALCNPILQSQSTRKAKVVALHFEVLARSAVAEALQGLAEAQQGLLSASTIGDDRRR